MIWLTVFLFAAGVNAADQSIVDRVNDLEDRVDHVEDVPPTTREEVHRVLISEGVPQQLEILSERTLRFIKIADEINESWKRLVKQGAQYGERFDWLVKETDRQNKELYNHDLLLRKHDLEISSLSSTDRTYNDRITQLEKNEVTKKEAVLNTVVQTLVILFSTAIIWWFKTFCKKRKLSLVFRKRFLRNRK